MPRSTFPAIPSLAVGLFLASMMLVAPLSSQEDPSAEQAAMMAAMTPGSQHAFLAEGAGNFKTTIKMWQDPSAPPMVSEGTAKRTMILGGRVLQEDFQTNMMGMPFEGVGHTGYDNALGKYWSTWSDNMSTSVSVLEGTVDTSTGKSTFEGETSEPMAGKRIPMRIETSREDGKETAEFYMPMGPGGEMIRTMEIVYERQ